MSDIKNLRQLEEKLNQFIADMRPVQSWDKYGAGRVRVAEDILADVQQLIKRAETDKCWCDQVLPGVKWEGYVEGLDSILGEADEKEKKTR